MPNARSPSGKLNAAGGPNVKAPSALTTPSAEQDQLTPPAVSQSSAPWSPDPFLPKARPRCPFRIGDVVGNAYRIVGEIGSGGYGVVYEAVEESLGRRVAIKTTFAPESELFAEARALAAFRNPGIVAIYGTGHHDGRPFIVMERLYGQNLEDYLFATRKQGKCVSVLETLDIMLSLTQTLSVVHRHGLVHRDIKPSNVMLASGGRRVLMDFGLFLPNAKLEAEPCGTNQYMAPETLQGSPASPAADVYSLGVTFFESLAGQSPIPPPQANSPSNPESHRLVRTLRQLRPDVPASLAALLRELLMDDPTSRPEIDAVTFRLGRIHQAILARTSVLQIVSVHDEPSVSNQIASWIREAIPNSAVRTACDTDSALTLVLERSPDALLVALDLPRWSGVELCMQLRGMGLADDCMIVALSATRDAADLEFLARLDITRIVTTGPPMKLELIEHLHAKRKAIGKMCSVG